MIMFSNELLDYFDFGGIWYVQSIHYKCFELFVPNIIRTFLLQTVLGSVRKNLFRNFWGPSKHRNTN